MKKIYILEVRIHGDLIYYLANNNYYTSLKKAQKEKEKLEKIADYADVHIRTLSTPILELQPIFVTTPPMLALALNKHLMKNEEQTNETTTKPSSNNRK